jgi:predicted RecB family endonuclease
MDITAKLKRYLLIEQEEAADNSDDVLFDMMVDFISTLDPDVLDEEQQDMLGELLDMIDVEDEDEDEDVSEVKIMRISRKEHMASKKAYRMKKALLKKVAKRWRASAAGKLWAKKHKRMIKQGKFKKKVYV